MTTADEPIQIGALRDDVGVLAPALRLRVGPISGFSQANMLLKRIEKLPGVRRAALSGVNNGALQIDIWSIGATRLDSAIRVLWSDFPGTTLRGRWSSDGVLEVDVALGQRPAA